MSELALPAKLAQRLAELPDRLRSHVQRVRAIARELAEAHGIDADLSELTAAAHDVARHLPGRHLLEEAGRLGLLVNAVETHAPVLLHGPVGAAWLRREGEVTDPALLEGVRWHTTASPDLAPVGRVVFLADKIDPQKSGMYPFLEEVRREAFSDLSAGLLAFLDGALKLHVDRGNAVHGMSISTRNSLIMARAC